MRLVYDGGHLVYVETCGACGGTGDQPCPDCHGDGTGDGLGGVCETCGGEGVDPFEYCSECGGDGQVEV